MTQRKRMKRNGNSTKIGILVWRPKAGVCRQSRGFTIADRIHDILLFAKNLQKKGASEIKLTLHLNRLKIDGQRVSLEDKAADALRHALRKHGVEESTIHFI